MSESGKAVFLSYASQDAEAAKKICDALRSAGVEVWFDQNELRGGDAWDQKIRRQIKECALFVPVISANTDARPEGYFRLEWKLAVDRSHLLADDHPFLFPIVVGDVHDATARVPEKFREVQWTRVRLDESPAELAARVARLLGGELEPGRPRPGTRGEGLASPKKDKKGFEKWWWLIFPIMGMSVPIIGLLKREPRPPPAPAVESAAKPEPKSVVPARSKARRLADQAFSLSVDKYDSTLDDFTTADALMKRAVALDADDGEILARSAQLQFMFRNRGFDYSPERIALGRQQAERAVRLVPDSAEAHVALSLAYRYTGNTAAMIEPLRRAVELDPQHARAQLWLGSRLTELGQAEEGRALHERARGNAEWAPLADYYGFLYNFGHLRFAEADVQVRRSFSARPSANSAGGIALLHLAWTGDLDKAVQELKGVPPVFLNTPRIVTLATLVHLHRRAPDEALRVLDRLPDEFIRDSWFTGPKALLVGRAHALANRTQAARLAWESGLRFVEEALQREPAEPAIHRARGELLALLGRTEEAMAAARTFDELTRGAVQNWVFSTATIHATLGRADLAVPKLAATLGAKTSGWPLTRTLLRQDPRWDPIRNDPAFAALLIEPAAASAPSVAHENAATPVDDKSVAVLAFANLSDDKANEYFSDGISEELLNVLAKVPGLKVSARTSAFYFKGKNTPIPEIARQLGVAYVVEGSVRRSGDRVRITTQLIKAADGFRVWNDTFTRDLQDIFAVQDEIAGLIAKSLSLQLGASSARKVTAVNPQAFELYVQGRQAWSLRTPEGFARAEQLLNRALELAPDFVRARAALIDVVQMRSLRERNVGTFGTRHSPEIEQRLAQVRAVLAIDPDLAEAYSTLGQALDSQWRRDEAGQAYRRATELNPNYATGRHWYGMHLAERGLMDEALAELKAACDLDPFSFIILDNYGWLLNLAGRRSEALQMLDRAAALNPGFDQTARAKAAALAALGRRAEAEVIARQLKNNQRELDVWTLGSVGLHAEAKALLARMDPRDVTNRFQALLSAGERDAALDALADPSGASKGDTIDLLYQPIFDPIRSDPRFIQYLTVLGIADAHARAQAWRRAHPPEEARGRP